MTIDRKTLLKYDPLPEQPRRGPSKDRLHALLIVLIGTPLIALEAAYAVSSKRLLIVYMAIAMIVGALLPVVIAVLGFLDGGLWGAAERLRYPLANWGTFGPTGGRFINHDDRWYWKRYAIAWLYLWMWLALPVIATISSWF